ncbi:MAG: cysteine desulfurase [Calditrichia bacterium]
MEQHQENILQTLHQWTPASIRDQFPILHQQIHGKPLVYFDNAATTQKPVYVIEALNHYYKNDNANIHRGIHTLAERATFGYEEARKKVKSFIHANSVREIVFTTGTTGAINLVAYSWGRANISEGDEIILTEMEHHSNMIPWQLLAKEKKAILKYIPTDVNGILDMDVFHSLLTSRTKLVCVTHMSNVFGTINPIKEIIQTAHEKEIPVLVDGAQSAPHIPVNVQDLDCDFYAFSGHKMMGPTGIGVLYAKEKWLKQMPPFLGGGEMIERVDWHSATYAELPYKFEAGTMNIAGAIGLGAAIDYLSALGMDKVHETEKEITDYALQKMRDIPGMEIYGNAPERGGVISFNLGTVHPHDLSHFLDREGIAVRAGHHCAQPLMRKLDLAATTRVSFYIYNTMEEVDILVESLKKAKEFFKDGI